MTKQKLDEAVIAQKAKRTLTPAELQEKSEHEAATNRMAEAVVAGLNAAVLAEQAEERNKSYKK